MCHNSIQFNSIQFNSIQFNTNDDCYVDKIMFSFYLYSDLCISIENDYRYEERNKRQCAPITYS